MPLLEHNPLSGLTVHDIQSQIKLQFRSLQGPAIQRLLDELEHSRAVLNIAATGAGKSILMGAVAAALAKVGIKTIIVAHREALVQQNAAKAQRVAGDAIVVGIEQAKLRARGNEHIVSASIGSLYDGRLDELLSHHRPDGQVICLMIDEAHHAIAASYQRVIRQVDPGLLMGFTATPFRCDGESLTEIFPTVGFNIPRGPLIDCGDLARDNSFTIKTNTSLAGVKANSSDYDDAELARALDVQDRNDLIIVEANKIRDRFLAAKQPVVPRAVAFFSTVAHAENMAAMFEEAGWEAHCVHGNTNIEDRRAAHKRLSKANKPVVVTSCSLLLEGWNNEEVNIGILARPTKSNVLMDQMIGRLLRKKAQNNWAALLYFDDLDSKAYTMSESQGLPKSWDCKGMPARLDEIWFQEVLRQNRVNLRLQAAIYNAESRDHVMAMLRDPSLIKLSILPGHDILWWIVGRELRAHSTNWSIVVTQNDLGVWLAQWREGHDLRHVIADGLNMEAVVWEAEKWLWEMYPKEARWLNIARSNGSNKLATDKQIERLKRIREGGNRSIPGDTFLAKLPLHEASIMINAASIDNMMKVEAGLWPSGKWQGFPIAGPPAGHPDWASYNGYLFGYVKSLAAQPGFLAVTMSKPYWRALKAQFDARNLTRYLDDQVDHF